MKTLADGTAVVDRTYYFLLDWNEQDQWAYLTGNFNKIKLSELNIREYLQLWEYATKSDTEYLNTKSNLRTLMDKK